MLRPSRSHLCLAAATLATLACRTPSSKIPLDELTEREEVQADGEAREVVEPLPVERPVDMLPAEVAVLAEAIDPSAVVAMASALDKHQKFAAMRSELRDRLGGDVFDPEQWDELGFDIHAPAGIGMLDLEVEGWFAYLSLVDEQKFEATLRRFADLVGASEQFSVTEVGGARVYRLDPEASVVVREKVALLVAVDDPEQAPRDYVVTAATIDPRESLGHSERFTWARAQIGADDDGLLFINPAELLAQIHRADQRSRDFVASRVADELAAERASKASPERIRQLEAQLEEERRWQREREARDAAERQFTNTLFGSIEALVGGAELREDGVVAHGRALIPEANLLRRMFVTPEHESPLLTALAEPPLFALDGRADLQVVLEIFDLFAQAEGETLESLNREIQAELGVDMVGTVIPALSGEGGIVLTQTREPDPKRLAEIPKTLGVAGYAGLRSPDTIRKALDGIARDKRLGGALVRAKRGDGWVLHVPKWHDVELTIVGDRLVLATDGKLATRIRNAERGAQADALTPEHPLRGPMQNPALRMYGRFVGALLVETREPWTQDVESMLYDFDSHHALTPEEARKVPRSRDYKRKLAELEKAVDELNAFNVRSAQARFERDLAFAEQFGDFGWQVEPVADGLELAGQWRFDAGTSPLDLGFQMFTLYDDSDWTERERLSNRCYGLVDELRMIRQADLDAAAAKKSK